ncbi:uncharacterized protein LOC114290781 [Camellia sinensis]|uniref:uncharacterized protein LOC114290781 n=1 Tax=Camellia sinensis TaxID=4442 RepID=UPI001035E70C|nr:uncharacterized protein LOC114290781 [Camellia sinensis]
MVESEPWKLMFDGSKTNEGVRVGFVLIAPNKQIYQFAYQLEAQHIQSCNQAQCEALIIGLELAIEFKNRSLKVFGDSQLIIKQVLGEFKCVSGALEEYLAEANGQVEATNKIMKNTLERMIEDNPRDWHNLLSEVLWAYKNSKRNSTGTTPYELVYGHDAVLPLEVTVRFNRLAKHLDIPMDEYAEAISTELQDLEEKRIMAFNHLIAQRRKLREAITRK